MLSTMLRAASTGGLGSLYATYAAFMLKSVPYDVAELATYSQMCDWREAAAAAAADGGSSEQAAPGWQAQLGGALAAMPSSASDMLIGGSLPLPQLGWLAAASPPLPACLPATLSCRSRPCASGVCFFPCRLQC
jgi:hypothetical protein